MNPSSKLSPCPSFQPGCVTASCKPLAKRPLRWILPALISAAAALALAFTLLWPGRGDMPAWQADSLAAIVKLQFGMSRLDERAPNLDAVKKLLAATSSPSPERPPSACNSIPTYGCKCIQIGTRPATIICFKLESGKEAHLVVLDNTGLADLPSQLQPQFIDRKNWHMATWSDGNQSFFLATTANEAELKKLFS